MRLLLLLPTHRSVVLLALLLLAGARPGGAAWDPPAGVDLTRPRLLFRAGDVQRLQARLEREPYISIAFKMMATADQARGVGLDDDSFRAHRIKSRAAKNLAFFYAVERSPGDGGVVPFAGETERELVGDRVRELLLHAFPHSRLRFSDPELGGWDRDISSSEELLQYVTAYDTLEGAGYDFGGDEAAIVERLVSHASELYEDYVRNGPGARLHQNNHRSKTGASLAAAAVALAEYEPAPGSDPEGLRDPAAWLGYGLDQVDTIMRHALVAGDGAYGEGPFYLRFASENLLPFLRAWDRLMGGADLEVDQGERGVLRIPSLWSHPLFARSLRWELDMTLPEGYLAPIDDGNPYRFYYFGAAGGPVRRDAAAFAWRWSTADEPYETDGNVDLGADSIVAFDDAVVPAPPEGSPTAFYHEGGNAIFRSDWTRRGVVAIALGEHGPASEFGRNRDGLGLSPQSHEHAEPGAFLLHAFGERLALDPGYVSFGQRTRVNRPEHHNMILVEDRGPQDFLGTSLAWGLDPAGPVPFLGHATLHDTLDTGFLDAARVTTSYGLRPAHVQRRFLFADDRYLVLADQVSSEAGPQRYSWLLHGNGGGTSGGAYEETPAGGRWTRRAARLEAGFAAAGVAMSRRADTAEHEVAGNQFATHTVLQADASPPSGTSTLRTVGLVYPSPIEDTPPELSELWLPEAPGAAALLLSDAAGDRSVLALHRAPPTDAGQPLHVPGSLTGLQDVSSDGHVLVVDGSPSSGLPRLLWSEGATFVRYTSPVPPSWQRGRRPMRATPRPPALGIYGASPGQLGLGADPVRVEGVVRNADSAVFVTGLPFHVRSVDGACGVWPRGRAAVVALGGERRFVLHARRGNGAPGADPGDERRGVSVGVPVELDGTESCDPDGDALVPRWELVSAPGGSDWRLDGAASWRPLLHVDRPGPFRVRLVVTDEHGAVSLPSDVLVLAGERCSNTVDDDLDGLFDRADPDCDGG